MLRAVRIDLEFERLFVFLSATCFHAIRIYIFQEEFFARVGVGFGRGGYKGRGWGSGGRLLIYLPMKFAPMGLGLWTVVL